MLAAHAVSRIIKLALPAGKANPSPPVGPALGAAGVNIMGFCKEYNAATQVRRRRPGDPRELTVATFVSPPRPRGPEARPPRDTRMRNCHPLL